MTRLGDFFESKGQDVDLMMSEISVMKQLIKERAQPLDLLRELLSNAGAKEVQATEIRINYYVNQHDVREMQWHPSQKIVKDNGKTVTASFELGNAVEFKRWLLGFGGNAKLLAPRNLVDDVRQELQRAVGGY